MVTQRRDRQLSVRLSQAEISLFEAARGALHARGVVRAFPTQADTLALLAAVACHIAGQGGYSRWHLQCRAALRAWEHEHTPGYLQLRVGPWLGGQGLEPDDTCTRSTPPQRAIREERTPVPANWRASGGPG